jgi:hypothetical protein
VLASVSFFEMPHKFLCFAMCSFKYSRQNQEGLYIEIIILMNKNNVVLVLLVFPL